jgi:hypothetical protein
MYKARILLLIGLTLLCLSCNREDNSFYATPENTIKTYLHAYEIENYDLAKSCFVKDKFLIPKELVKNVFAKYTIIDVYMSGEDTKGHLYTKGFEKELGNIQVVVDWYSRKDSFHGTTIYYLKKIDNSWMIYSFLTIGDD